MKVLTIASKKLNVREHSDIILPDPTICRYPDNKPLYQRLFNDYNLKNHTRYKGFFWGFSDLLTESRKDALSLATGMLMIKNKREFNAIFLDVPENLLLETNFYYFTDNIFYYLNNEPEKIDWEVIYKKFDNHEKQVIYPYINTKWIYEIVEKL